MVGIIRHLAEQQLGLRGDVDFGTAGLIGHFGDIGCHLHVGGILAQLVDKKKPVRVSDRADLGRIDVSKD